MDESTLRNTLLDVIESSLEAQIRAVRRLRSEPKSPHSPPLPTSVSEKGMSQVNMAHDILSSGQVMHINEIITAISKRFDVQVDRESLVSALSKRVARGDRFRRTDKNTFSLLTTPQA